jgi:hypothetical protein
MRSIGLVILAAVAFIWAEEPPPPYIMHIYMKDSTSDSLDCSRLDTATGVTFDRFNIKVGILDPDIMDPVTGAVWKGSRVYCLNQIDSITFTGGPPPTPPPDDTTPADGSGTGKRAAAKRLFHR